MRIKKRDGFSLIEVIIAVSILVVMAGIAVPVIGSQMDKAKVSKICSMVDSLRMACDQYYSDTGAFATEYSGATYATVPYHTLSLEQTSLSTWDGPYLDHPLSTGDNPFGGFCYLYPNLTGGTANPNGFNLLGTGNNTHTGNGNFIGFGSVPESVAEKVDEALDDGVSGDWKSTGRVEYSGTTLSIYLTGGN